MTKKELIELLEPYPDNITIWVSDGGYLEGATPLSKVYLEFAFDADLDGDLVSDEYTYDLEKENNDDYTKIIRDEQTILTKKVLIIE